jgi:hypothetical protein
MSPRRILIPAALCAVHGCLLRPVPADITKPKEATGGAPVVHPQTVHVLRGQTVAIELKGTSAGSMVFELRTPPKFGTVAEKQPVPKTKVSATVHYTASPDAREKKDEFTFTAKVPGSSTSEPAAVTILISDAMPKLDITVGVMGGRIILERPRTKPFVLRNTGNAPWAARVPAPKGWTWVHPPGGEFRIGAGEEFHGEIRCNATALGTLDETVPLLGDTSMRFTARVDPPFSIVRKHIDLRWDGENRKRSGGLDIENHDIQKLTVKVEGPDWLVKPGSVVMDAEKREGLVMSVEGKFERAFSGTVKLSAGSYSQLVEVKAAPAPALLAIVSGPEENGGIHFGVLTEQTLPTAKRSLTLRNEGGSPAVVSIETPQHFRLEAAAPADGVPLTPGAEATFVILPPVDIAGKHRGNFVASAGDVRASVELTAGIPRELIKPTAGEIADRIIRRFTRAGNPSRPRTEDEHRQLIGLVKDGFRIGGGNEDPRLPRVDVVDLEQNGGDFTLSWELPPGDGWTFQLYHAAAKRMKTGAPIKEWIPCGDEVKYRVENGRGYATVGGLPPGVWYKCSLQTIAPDGRRSLRGKEFGFMLHPADPPHWKQYWEWYLAGGAGLLALAYWLRKKWKEPISAVAT